MTNIGEDLNQRRLQERMRVSRFVDRDEFCNLLVGYKRLDRADDPSSGVRGLIDLDTDTLYLIRNGQLANPL